MGFFIFQKYDTDVTFEKVMGQCHLSLTVAANDGEVLYRRKTENAAFSVLASGKVIKIQ